MQATLTSAWVLKLMLSLASADDPPAPWAETYGATAEAIAAASPDRMTASVLVSIAFFESHFNPGALGDCRKGRDGKPVVTLETCNSLGLFQISKSHAPAMELFLPPTAAAHARRLVGVSRRMCGDGENALSNYATGGPVCVPNLKESRHRMLLASRLLRKFDGE